MARREVADEIDLIDNHVDKTVPAARTLNLLPPIARPSTRRVHVMSGCIAVIEGSVVNKSDLTLSSIVKNLTTNGSSSFKAPALAQDISAVHFITKRNRSFVRVKSELSRAARTWIAIEGPSFINAKRSQTDRLIWCEAAWLGPRIVAVRVEYAHANRSEHCLRSMAVFAKSIERTIDRVVFDS